MRPVSASVHVGDATGRLGPATVPWLHQQASRAVAHLGVGGECRVRLVGDVEITAAHRRHLDEPGPTDVLTFDLSDPADPGDRVFLDADLMVCVDEARRQSARRGTTLEQELLLYIIHGMLHCLGHDDHSDADARAMHALEDEILRSIGVGPVYSLGARGEEPKGGEA
jgi:probable rRNA maturation factor